MRDKTDPRFSREGSKAGTLQRAAYQQLLKHESEGQLPTSDRFLFYELEHSGIVSKERTGARRADQDLGEAILHLRKKGLVPWGWIVDETRSVTIYPSYPSVLEGLRRKVGDIDLDPWISVPRPMIIVEARTAGGVLGRTIAPHYHVPLISLGGQVHGFLMTEVLPLVQEQDTLVLYLGDLDLAGGHIEKNARTILEEGLDGQPLEWRRIAITQEQAAELERQGIEPIEKTDRRYKGGAKHLAWELEALGQRYITDLVSTVLDRLLPEPLHTLCRREEAEQDEMKQYLYKYRPPLRLKHHPKE